MNVTQSQFCVSSPYARDSMKRGKSTNCSTAELVLEFFAKKNSSSNCCLWHVVQCSVHMHTCHLPAAAAISQLCSALLACMHFTVWSSTPGTSCSLHVYTKNQLLTSLALSVFSVSRCVTHHWHVLKYQTNGWIDSAGRRASPRHVLPVHRTWTPFRSPQQRRPALAVASPTAHVNATWAPRSSTWPSGATHASRHVSSTPLTRRAHQSPQFPSSRGPLAVGSPTGSVPPSPPLDRGFSRAHPRRGRDTSARHMGSTPYSYRRGERMARSAGIK